MYGVYGKVKNMFGHIHKYLGLKFYFSDKDKVKIDIIDYMNAMVNNFPVKFKSNDTILDPETGFFF